MNSLSIKIGFWSAFLFTLASAAYGAAAGIFFSLYPIPSWSGIYAYASFMSSTPQNLFSFCQVLAFLSGLLFIPLLCSIHDFAQEEKKILAKIGICFGVVFVVLSSMCYFIQFTIVPQNILSGQINGLEHFVELNTKSFIAAITVLGWGLFFGLTTLFIAPVFSGGKRENVIRWSFIITGIFCILNTLGFMLQNIMLSIASTLIFNSSVLIACISLCMLFKRLKK